MQSGISASQELHAAFKALIEDSSSFGLLVDIQNEQLVPSSKIPSTSSDFNANVPALESLLKDNEAAYIIVRRYPDASDPFVAITYVPDSAKVRQKMLFASTRLTLVKELGGEKFRESFFTTTKAELTVEGFKRHDKHGELKAPLTEEEETLQKVKDAEAEESRGTGARASHVNHGVRMAVTPAAVDALQGLATGNHTLVQLKIDIPKETIDLADVSSTDVDSLATTISATEPRYSFFKYTHENSGASQSPVLFIYTCPDKSKVKERMLYSVSSRSAVVAGEADGGLTIEKRLEASDPSDITKALIDNELHPQTEQKTAFSRPKRPGRK